ncbi:MAG: AAA family ATPase [Cellvibrionaceae bacterium]|nr:AAA family ATPase [Cellvibrionaceae bacterium]
MATKITDVLLALSGSLNSILLGKQDAVQLALACILARGHLLLEDLPGMGKTTLAQGLAKVLGLDFQRVQFTNDLLPSDVLGVSVFNPKSQSFEFRPGPIFTQVLLADEINRTSPKTQSALLEAMSENQVTIDGVSHDLDDHFFVIATQNAVHQTGTFALPESQLDRFMMRISLGYPDPQAERMLLEGSNPQQALRALTALVSSPQLEALQLAVGKVNASEQLLDYLQRLLAYSRESGEFNHGLSPRAALAWLHCAKAWALLYKRAHVLPEDLQKLILPVAGHRLLPTEPLSVVHNAVVKMIASVPVIL